LTAWLDRVLREERDTYLLGLVRIGVSLLLLAHVHRLAQEYLRDGYFGDVFHLPIVPEALVPTRAVYGGWLVLQVAAALLALIGVRAREALLFVSSSCLYVLLCDRLQYHNNRYALLLLGFLLAFTPCDRSVVWPRRRLAASPHARGPLWAQRLMQLQVSLIYLASSGGKLLDRDWRDGHVLLLRSTHLLDEWSRAGWHVPGVVAGALSSPLLFDLASKAGIASELFLALGLWQPRLRPYALWLGVMFHLGIELSARVELFSWLMWTTYVLFATPECGERVLRVRADAPRAQRLARVVRALDWLARFRIETESAADAPAFMVIDRDGGRATGLRAFTRIARAVPLLFPLWFPLHLSTLHADAPAASAGAAAASR
jgi:hypothetical protein